MLANIAIIINESLYVKNPESSDLGKKIIEHSIILIEEIGFEAYTFKKLGERIQSNESSIYRYFESKHQLLVYLSSWYWSWIEYRVIMATANIINSQEKLEKAIAVITENIIDDTSTPHINENLLHKIIVSEFSKTFLTKDVDQENKKGYFIVYKRVINLITKIIVECNPHYQYPKSLASTVVQSALHQQYLKVHLKTITDFSDKDSASNFFIEMVTKTLKK